MDTDLLSIKNLSIGFNTDTTTNWVVENISYRLEKNKILGIVGESGSGKSVSSLAILGLLSKKTAQIKVDEVRFDGKDLSSLSEKEFRKIRGNEIAMIFQEPMSSLNPSLSCGYQVAEILKQHTSLSAKAIKTEVLSLFEKVKLPTPERMYNSYPHEISGGQKQRVMIAMAIACKPKLLIADEPTTALDVTVQKEIILLLKALQQETGMGIIFITHDLALVSEIADTIVVMYKGKIVEKGDAKTIFSNPKESYTKALLNAKPALDVRLKKLPTIADFYSESFNEEQVTSVQRKKHHEQLYAKPPLLVINNLEKTYFSKSGFLGKKAAFKAVNNVSFKLYEGETLGLVGESGCGKSTLGNAILQLDKATAGQIVYRGNDITNLSNAEMRALRKDIQIIFQDPYSSLNPRIKVGLAITEPMKTFSLYHSQKERKEKAISILESVGLEASHYNRYPHEFSGGQRQRIGIARTIAIQPKLIICDESVSALDISVQAQVLNLLNDLKEKHGFTYIFISHDLSVVKYMSDQLIVMNKGKIEEEGDADTIYSNPKKEYTKKLIDAIPKGIY